MSLESDIRAVKIGLVNGIEDTVVEMALSVFSTIVLSTPVDTGRARGNWQPTFGAPPTSALIATDKGGQATISKAKSVFPQWEFGDKIFITNNVAYIQRLNEGHSQQERVPGFVQRGIVAGIKNLDGQGDLFS